MRDNPQDKFRREPLRPEALRVDRDRTVGDLRSSADCEAALIELRTSIAVMDQTIASAREKLNRTIEEEAWLRRATTALTLKRAAISAIREKLDSMRRAERIAREQNEDVQLLTMFRQRFPQQFRECLDEVKQARV